MSNTLMLLRSTLLAAFLLHAVDARAQLPVTGLSVSQLSWLDDEMQDFMDEFNITGGLLAIMRNGTVIYQRGFGWNDSSENIAMPENSLVRIASCTKPITAAAIRKLEAEGALGTNGLSEFAFALGRPSSGILPHVPYPSLGHSDLMDVRVRDLLTHQGGWDRTAEGGPGDITYMECAIAGDMGVNSPPGRDNTMRWILGQPLQFEPGMDQVYSNVGYLALGLIVEEVTGQTLLTYLRENILTPDMWIPSTDFRMGRTFEAYSPAREAWYDGRLGFRCVFDTSDCVFGCDTAITNSAYGAWDHEARTGQGAVVLSPAVMLRFLDTYYVQSYSEDIGLPLEGKHYNGSHGGSLQGTNTLAWQRADGVNVFIFFNKDSGANEDGAGHFGKEFRSRIEERLDNQRTWPTFDVEGFWVEPSDVHTPAVYGSYNRPFNGMLEVLNTVAEGSRLNLKGGDYRFYAPISKKVRIRAPLGMARIGVGLN